MPNPLHLTFDKSYNLKSRKAIDLLFKEGHSHFQYPLKLQYLAIKEESNKSIKFTVSVPKKKFKLAVDRNRLKRQIRESFRLNFRSYFDEKAINTYTDQYYAIMFIYVATEKLSYQKIEKSMQYLIQKLEKTMEV